MSESLKLLKLTLDSSNETVFQHVIESAPIGIYFNDLKGTFLYGNKRAEEIIGFSLEELRGRNFLRLNLLDAKGLRTAAKHLRQNRKGRDTGPEEFILRRKDNTKAVVEITTTCFTYQGTKAVLGMVRDVTEQKQFEMELRASEERHRLINENTDNLIALMTFSLNPTYIYVSPSHERLLGYEPGELIGKTGIDYIHPEDRRNLYPILKEYFNRWPRWLRSSGDKHPSETVEFRVRDSLGNWRYLESTVNFSGGNLLFVSRDVTERKEATQKIGDQHAQISALSGVNLAMAETVDLVDVLKTIQKELIKVFSSKHGPLFALYEGAEEQFEIKLTWYHESLVQQIQKVLGVILDGMQIPIPESLKKIAISHEPHVFDDINEFAKTVFRMESLPNLEMVLGSNSIIYVPLWTKDKLIGGMFFLPEALEIRKVHMDLLSELGNQAAIAIERAQLYEQIQKERDIYMELYRKYRESEIRSSIFFEESEDCFYIAEKDGRVTHLNPAGQKMFGYSDSELDDLTAADFYVNLKDRESFISKMDEKEYVQNYLQRFKHRDGSEIICRETAVKRTVEDRTVYQGIIREAGD